MSTETLTVEQLQLGCAGATVLCANRLHQDMESLEVKCSLCGELNEAGRVYVLEEEVRVPRQRFESLEHAYTKECGMHHEPPFTHSGPCKCWTPATDGWVWWRSLIVARKFSCRR